MLDSDVVLRPSERSARNLWGTVAMQRRVHRRTVLTDVNPPRYVAHVSHSPSRGSRMLAHLILGLLRNGEPRHGYQLVTHHRALTGASISTGNVYRELSRLAARALVLPYAEDPGGDARRIPYQITEQGRELFDQWLLAPAKHGDELASWLIFMDRVPRAVRDRTLERARDMLWSQSKALERAREDALARHQATRERYHPLAVLLSRRLRQVTADLEFLNELRADIAAEDATVAATVGPSRTERAVRASKRPGR
jgi:DNA-binding PadR family transcriptional regulator